MGNKLKNPKTCPRCGEKSHYFTGNICHNCYRKYEWKREKVECPRCGKMKPHHAKGLCNSCYNYVYKLEEIKAHNYKKWYGISPEVYKRVREKCVICGFEKVVDIHHLDEDKENNSEENLIGLCPNHHKMLHDYRYKKEILNKLRQEGIEISEEINTNFTYET